MIGLYSNNAERFLLVKDDQWIGLQTARILSSKFFISVFNFENKKINNTNCINWGLKNPGLAMLDRQIPAMKFIENQVVDLKKPPLDIPKEIFIRYQKYATFCYNVTFASRITDALLNHGNQDYFLSLLDITPDLKIYSDDTGLPVPFLTQIDKTLYMSTSIDEARQNIDNIFLTETNMVSQLKFYKSTFYSYLKTYESIL